MAEAEVCVNVETKKKEKFDEWEINNMVDTIIRAEEIKKDKEKMKYVLPELNKRIKALDAVSKSIKKPTNKQELFEELSK